MNARAVLALACVLLAGTYPTLGAARAAGGQASIVAYEGHSAAMTAAIAAARKTLPNAIEAATRRGDISPALSLKVTFQVSTGREHIWVDSIRRTADGFAGILANEPRYLAGKRMGSSVDFSRDSIIDWSLTGADGRWFGQYTTRVMLPDLPPDEVRRIEARLAASTEPGSWD